MKALIVDDEYPIVQGMLSMVDWNSLGIGEVRTAYSVDHAIEILRSEQIEIIITDIKMKGRTGLDLLDWVNRIRADCAKIILTSYPDFNFAKEAISLGVMEYLLKPVSEKALEDAVRKAVDYVQGTQRRSGSVQAAGEDSRDPEEEGRMVRIERYIKEHIDENISRDDLCRELNLSPNYLSRAFREKSGMTLQNYIKQVRIQEAQRLLRYTNRPVTLIAQDTGYTTLSYFSSVFREATGMTPFAYRKQKKAGDTGTEE